MAVAVDGVGVAAGREVCKPSTVASADVGTQLASWVLCRAGDGAVWEAGKDVVVLEGGGGAVKSPPLAFGLICVLEDCAGLAAGAR